MKRRSPYRRIIIICICIVIALIIYHFLIPRNLIPTKYNRAVCLSVSKEGEQITITDEQFDTLLKMFSEYKVTGTLYLSKEFVDAKWHFSIMFSGPFGKTTSQTREIRLGYDVEYDQGSYVNGYGTEIFLLKKIKNGDQLLQEVDELMTGWGY